MYSKQQHCLRIFPAGCKCCLVVTFPAQGAGLLLAALSRADGRATELCLAGDPTIAIEALKAVKQLVGKYSPVTCDMSGIAHPLL